jgi:hypothetical protein
MISSNRIATASALAAGLLSGLSMEVAAEDTRPQSCTVEGMNANGDPVFRSSLHPSQRQSGIRDIACGVEASRVLTAGDIQIRLTLGRLYEERVGGPQLRPALISIEKIDSSGSKPIARVFLDPDALDGEMRFEPQARNIAGAILIRLSPRHRWLYRLEGDTLSPLLAFGWRDGIDGAFPDNAKSGEALSLDLDRMEGRIAVRSIGKDPGQRLPSAYDENRVVVAKLAWRNNQFIADSTATAIRQPGEQPFLDDIAEMDEKVRKGLKNLPQGIEPCSLGAWSNDTDPKGLNVRAAPDAKARVLGIVPPLWKMPKGREVFGPEPVKAEFRIVGQKDSWFLIEKIAAPGTPYGEAYPRHLPQPFKGRGWVNGRMVGAAYAHGGLPEGRLYLSPHADAGFLDASDKSGNPISADGSPARILACSGWWALIETDTGQRGWKRSLCSSQVTNCS